MMNTKAQESRNDLLILYLVCFVVVVSFVGGLYGFGMIGQTKSNSLSEVTGAAVAGPNQEIPEPLTPDTETNSSVSESLENS